MATPLCRFDAARRPAEPFLPLEENRLARTALQRLLPGHASRSQTAYLYGPSGIGKTHLVRCFLARWSRRDCHCPAAILDATTFATYLTQQVSRRQADLMHGQLQDLDCLVIEDLAGAAGHPEAQHRLAAVFDEITSRGGRIVLTCSRLPGELPGLIRRLAARCRSGAAVAIAMPGPDARRKLLRHFAEQRQIPISDSAVELISQSCPVSPRELLALLLRVDACAGRSAGVIKSDLARRVLNAQPVSEDAPLDQIARAAAQAYSINVENLNSRERGEPANTARQLAMCLAAELTDLPLGRIAAFFGRKHHSTVTHARRHIQERMLSDPELKAAWKSLHTAFKSGENG